MIHRTMELNGVQGVREVLAAGDTANDLLAATRAGVTAVGVLTGKLDRAAPARCPHQHILDAVRNIPAILAEAPTNQSPAASRPRRTMSGSGS